MGKSSKQIYKEAKEAAKLNKYYTREVSLGKQGINEAYVAKERYKIEEVIGKFKHNVESRIDLSPEFKQELLNQPIGTDYEITYWPVYFYKTETDVRWEEKAIEDFADVTDSAGYNLATVWVESTHYYEKKGIQGVSKLSAQGIHGKSLNITDIDLDNVWGLNNFKSIKVQLSESIRFYNSDENKKKALKAGREISGATSGQSTYTHYRTCVILVPVFRYKFNYQGKICLFEMNLHNGAIRTDYKQKPLCAAFKCGLPMLFNLFTAYGLIVDAAILLLHLIFAPFIGGFWRIAIGLAVAIAGVAVAYIREDDSEPTSFDCEKMISVFDVGAATSVFLLPMLLFDASVILANIAGSILFAKAPIITVVWILSAIIVLVPTLTWVVFKVIEFFTDLKSQKVMYGNAQSKYQKSTLIFNKVLEMIFWGSCAIPVITLLISIIFGKFYAEAGNIIFGVIIMALTVFLCILQGKIIGDISLDDMEKLLTQKPFKFNIKLLWRFVVIALLIIAIFITSIFACGIVFWQ